VAVKTTLVMSCVKGFPLQRWIKGLLIVMVSFYIFSTSNIFNFLVNNYFLNYCMLLRALLALALTWLRQEGHSAIIDPMYQ